jgi:hypothetical protein
MLGEEGQKGKFCSEGIQEKGMSDSKPMFSSNFKEME